MKFGILLIAVSFLYGCSSFPERMTLSSISNEIVEYVENTYFLVNSEGQRNVPISAPSLVLSFEGQAPFAYIKGEGKQAQFRCNLMNSKGDIITDTEIGSVYFDGIKTPPNSSVDYYSVYNDERFRYRVFLYRTLKAKREVNSEREFDLINDEYDHIRCHLVGVQMLGGFMYSNDILITRDEFLKIYESYQNNRIDSGVQSLEDFVRTQR
jgi:hypothetical protein